MCQAFRLAEHNEALVPDFISVKALAYTEIAPPNLSQFSSHRPVGEDRISRDADVIPCSGLVPDAAHRGKRAPTLEHEREIDRGLKRAIRRERSARLNGDRYSDVLLSDQYDGCSDSFAAPRLESLDEESFRFDVRIMAADALTAFVPIKMPVQARSAITVKAISEATIQILLSQGAERLTTTWVYCQAPKTLHG